jgi:cobalamin biosynthesis Mg chelatase CobN
MVRDTYLEETSYTEQDEVDQTAINKLNPTSSKTNQSNNNEYEDESDSAAEMETDNHNHDKARRKSQRIKASKKHSHNATTSSKKSTSKKSSKKQHISSGGTANKELLGHLKTIIHKCFGYDINEFDIGFISQIFTQLPKLNEIWSRIGFTTETKQTRLEKFYNEVFVSGVLFCKEITLGPYNLRNENREFKKFYSK